MDADSDNYVEHDPRNVSELRASAAMPLGSLAMLASDSASPVEGVLA